jgi:hypothetical protein
MNKAAEHIQKAAAYVHKEGAKVAQDSKEGVKKAGDQLSKLGEEVKKGTVKSGDQLKKTFAQVDHSLAKAWHATADQTQKSGKDATDALKKAPARGRCRTGTTAGYAGPVDGPEGWRQHQRDRSFTFSATARRRAKS